MSCQSHSCTPLFPDHQDCPFHKARRDLESQIKKLEKTGEEGWENTLLNVSLPASVVRELLQRQDKAAASAKAAEAKAADDDSAE